MAQQKRDMNLKTTFRYVSLASMLTTAATARTQTLDNRTSTEATGERFNDFLAWATEAKDSTRRKAIVDAFVDKVKSHGRAIIEDSTVYFIYNGNAKRVGVPSDLNGWSPAADTMKRVDKTDFFYLSKTLDQAARFEYKLAVDSIWMLDPLNQQQAIGGYGPNSEIWMPRYALPKDIEYRANIPHGVVDTLSFKSKLLGRSHPVFVYLPHGYKNARKKFSSIYITDGGEYISLALMLNVLDNLIADKRIEPVVGIFVDPRTDVRDIQTSKRMYDYSMSDTFVNALVHELRPRLLKKYKLTTKPDRTAIMGASLGGLIATYAAYTQPEVFGLCAAQSPAYWWKEKAILKLMEAGPKKSVKFYIDTGTIRDAQSEAKEMKHLLESKGYQVMYREHPESHNWVNWRARLDDILIYFWGTK